MKIGVISDTHGAAKPWEAALEYFSGADLILHAGDVLYHGPRNPLPEGHGPMRLVELLNGAPCPLIVARGNCDAAIDLELLGWPVNDPYAFVRHEGLRIILSHGHYGEGLLKLWAKKGEADLVISGHTHQAKLERVGDTIYLNPGSPALPKGGPASIAVIEDGVVQILSLSNGEVLTQMQLGA